MATAQAVLVNTDPDFAAFAVELNSTVVYLDILYWMWHAVPAVVGRCDAYVYEDFVRSIDQVDRLGLPPHAVRVGPLIPPLRSSHAAPLSSDGHRTLLVSVGGLYRPGGAAQAVLSAYERMVTRAVIDALPPGRFEYIHFAGGGLKTSTATLADGTRVTRGCLPRSQYLQLLATATAAILSPGLTGFFEAAAAGVPVFYLPPHNYSQYLQLESFKAVLGDAFYADWTALGCGRDLPCFLPEQDMLDATDAVLSGVVCQGEELTRRLRMFLAGEWESFDPRPAATMLNDLRSPDGDSTAVAHAADVILRRLPDRAAAAGGCRPEERARNLAAGKKG